MAKMTTVLEVLRMIQSDLDELDDDKFDIAHKLTNLIEMRESADDEAAKEVIEKIIEVYESLNVLFIRMRGKMDYLTERSERLKNHEY